MKNLVIRISFLISGLFIGNSTIAQCPPPGDLDYFHQFDLDEFRLRYPLCEEINGNLRLWGPDIRDLSPLSNIRKIHGDLFIYETALTTFTGLNSLVEVLQNIIIRFNHSVTNMSGFNHLNRSGGLELRSNFGLNSLMGLESLQLVNNAIVITGSSDLVNLNGLNGLIYTHSLVIATNAGLTSLTSLENLRLVEDYFILDNNPVLISGFGLNNLEYVGSLEIMNCPGITNLSGLESLLAIERTIRFRNNTTLDDISAISNTRINNPTELEIVWNTRLSNCSIENICTNFSEFDIINVGGNMANCNSRAEILDNCFIGRSRKTQNSLDPLVVIPNPNDGYFYIDGLQYLSSPANLKIISSEGKIILNQELKVRESIDLRYFPSGLYTLVIQDELNTTIKRIIKN